MIRRDAVIWDMDGVLVDSEPLYIEADYRVFVRVGVDLPRNEIHQFVGICAAEMWRVLKARFGLQQPVEALVAMQRQAHFEILRDAEDVAAVPGAVGFLRELAGEGRPMALASSSSLRVIALNLGRLGVRDLFAAVVSGEQVSAGKPDPEIFLTAAEVLGVPPTRCLVIEDSHHGTVGARAAGMACVGFRNPNSGNQDLSAADLVINDFEPPSIAAVREMLA